MSRSLLFWRTRMDLVCNLRVFIAGRIAEKISHTMTSAKKFVKKNTSLQVRRRHNN